MLNYIWAGLIIASLLFAGASDIGDLTRDTYRNGQALPVQLAFPVGYEPSLRESPVEIQIDGDVYRSFYGTDAAADAAYSGTLVRTEEGSQLRFEAGAALPEPLATIAGVSRSNDDELQGELVGFNAPSFAIPRGLAPGVGQPPPVPATVRFQTVRFVKINAMSAAALEFAGTAAEIALGLVGVLALFLGFMKIAEAAGVIYAIVKLVRPVLRPLFPEVPPDHPAFGMIALNLAANVFGLGNAATPFGIRAMEELQKLNPSTDTATNPMVMLLAINTASVQIVPPVLLLALMGLQINELIFPILVTTGLGLVVAIGAVKLYGRLPAVRASDPNRNPPPAPAEASLPV